MPRSEASLRSGDPAAAAAPGSWQALRQHCVAPMLDEKALPTLPRMGSEGVSCDPSQGKDGQRNEKGAASGPRCEPVR